MEVYKITCLVTDKVYIGSTKLDKFSRWGDLSSRSSHLSCARDGDPRPLYEDIRNYGEDSFLLETLEEVEGDRLDAYRREDFWIKKFWKDLGSARMYNQYDSACGHNDWSVPHDESIQLKAAESRRRKYGTANGACLTPEALAKARNTRQAKYGIYVPVSPEGRASQTEKVSHTIRDTKFNDNLIGYKGVHQRLLSEGYDITFWVVKRIVSGYVSKRSFAKYPDLIDRFYRIN